MKWKKLIGDLRRELADQREHNRKLREQIPEKFIPVDR